ncbi:MAG: glycosyltransferase [Thermoleophilaceae bacterium]|nr:glycosyltransferase [Thermoleophilaceae bacterium]
MSGLSYSVVTPARNEERNLQRLGRALAVQTQRPAEWVVVEDGSTDATPRVLADLAARYWWVQPLERTGGNGLLAAGRRDARDLIGFRAGIERLSMPVDVVIKIDADIDFDSDFCERLVAEFAADETLGIASGTCYERERGEWVRRTKMDTTVWGATRAYRGDCIPDLMELEPCMGWDGLDEIRVQLRGLRTRTLVDLPFRHHRPEGGRELTSLHHGEALGRASWYMGYRPSYLMMRALYRLPREPAAVGMLWGYAAAAATRAPRCPDDRVIRALRERQRLGVALRRGAPAS